MRSHPAKHGEGFDAPPTLERSGSEHRRAVTSLALLERERAWEWVKDPPPGEGQVGHPQHCRAVFLEKIVRSRQTRSTPLPICALLPWIHLRQQTLGRQVTLADSNPGDRHWFLHPFQIWESTAVEMTMLSESLHRDAVMLQLSTKECSKLAVNRLEIWFWHNFLIKNIKKCN